MKCVNCGKEFEPKTVVQKYCSTRCKQQYYYRGGKTNERIITPDAVQPMNRLAREQMKLKILRDIRVDIMICELEGWDETEYIRELQEVINEFRTGG